MASFDFGIKNKRSKPRQTLAKQIKELANKDIHSAMLLAETGRHFTDAEKQIHSYFRELEEFLQMKAGKKTIYQLAMERALVLTKKGFVRNRRVVEKCVERDRARLCKMFIAALDAKDANQFHEIGRIIERLKVNSRAGDRYRSEILKLKRLCDIVNGSLTIRNVAKQIGWPHDGNDDGFSQLRKLCRELNFPLAPSRQIRRKN